LFLLQNNLLAGIYENNWTHLPFEISWGFLLFAFIANRKDDDGMGTDSATTPYPLVYGGWCLCGGTRVPSIYQVVRRF
jgi:hypothetical protein